MSTFWSALLAVLTRLLTALATEKFLEWALFHIAEQIVKRTPMPHDDVWYGQMRAAYFAKKDGG